MNLYLPIRYRFLLLLAGAFLFPGANAQVTKNKLYLMPENYTHPYGPHERDMNTSTCVTGGRKQEEWIVYSDRENNQLYLDLDLKKKGKVAAFMDAFYVIEEICDKGVVHVIKFDKSILKSKKNWEIDPKAAVDMGYISKKNLLLWKHSLEDDSTNFTIKGLPAHKIERFIEIKSSSKFTKSSSELKLFDAPDMANANDNTIRLFEFLYIYKKEGNAFLLGKSDAFSPQSVTEILGWAPKSYIEEWNQRICIEPNINPEAVNERAAKNIKASLFQDLKTAIAFEKDSVKPKPLFIRDNGTEPYNPYIKRFPVIRTLSNGNIIQTRASTDIYGSNKNEPVMSIQDQGDYNKKIGPGLEKVKKFNIVFVVEASSRISREYLKQVLNGLDDLDKQLMESEDVMMKTKEYEFNFGAVVYRSYEHGSCSGTTDLVASAMDKLLPKDDYYKVQDFLGSQLVMTTDCDSRANGKALYKGLDKALSLFKDTTETNILVLIGTIGDKSKEKVFDKQILIDKMAHFKTSFIAYQYNNASGEDYEKFVQQIRTILRQSARKITKAVDPRAPDADFLETGETNVFELDPKTSAVPGKALVSSNNSQMPPEKLREELNSAIQDLQHGVGLTIEGAEALIGGVGKDTAMSYAMKLLFNNSGINVNDPDVMRDLSSDNFQLFVPCYAVIKPNGLNKSLFRNVILINTLEFSGLITILNSFGQAGNNASEMRAILKETFVKVIKDHFGERESRHVLKNKNLTIGKIMELLTGLPAQSELLRRVKLEQIDDEDEITDSELQTIVNGISEKYDRLRKILNDPNNKYSFTSSGDKYYWVPQEDMP